MERNDKTPNDDLTLLKEAVFDWLSHELGTSVRGKFAPPYEQLLDYVWSQREEQQLTHYNVGQLCTSILLLLEENDSSIMFKFSIFPSALSFAERRFGKLAKIDDNLHAKMSNMYWNFIKHNICAVTDGRTTRTILTTTPMSTVLPWLSSKYRPSDAMKYCLVKDGVGPVEELEPAQNYTLQKRPVNTDTRKQKLE